MKIEKVKIENFKNIDNLEANLKGKNVYIVAGNGKGKTSFIDACFCNIPKEAIKIGEDKGRIELEFVNGIHVLIELGKKITITDKEGNKISSPSTYLKELFSIAHFDIDNFLNLSMSKKIDFLKNMLGIDWTDIDEKYNELYNERTFLNREYKTLQSSLEGKEIIKDFDVPDLLELQQSFAFETESERIEKEIERLQSLLKGRKRYDLEVLKSEIEKVSTLQAKKFANLELIKKSDSLKEIANKLEGVNSEMERIKDFKVRELQENRLDVEGLEMGIDSLTLDGVPFEFNNINTAKRIITSLDIQYSLMKKNNVRMIRFDGTLLDKENLKAVEKWANDKGIQLFIELVGNGELKIEVYETYND